MPIQYAHAIEVFLTWQVCPIIQRGSEAKLAPSHCLFLLYLEEAHKAHSTSEVADKHDHFFEPLPGLALMSP